MPLTEIVIATHNAGKLAEIKELLNDMPIRVRSNQELGVHDVEETGLTFVENALIKARNACAHTDHAALADDSGLEVDMLRGAPGIYSSRFAGDDATDEQNITMLLEAMDGVPFEQRTARFRCCMVVMRHAADPSPLICNGVWEGHIANEKKGQNGFGYDPVFLPVDAIGSAAQLSGDQKQRLSHRALALRALRQQIIDFINSTRK